MKNLKSKSSISLFIGFAVLLILVMMFGTACGNKPGDTEVKKPTTLVIGQYEEGTQFAGKYYVQMGSYPQTKCELEQPQLVSGKTYNFKNQENEVYTDGTNEYVKYNNQYFKIEPVKWVVIGNENGDATPTFSKKAKGTYTLISEKILVQQIFNKEAVTGNKWNGSEIQSFMNNKLYNDLFTKEEKAVIKDTILTTTYKGASSTMEDTLTTGDKMFLLGMKDQTSWDDTAVRGDTYTVDLIEQLVNNNKVVCKGGQQYESLKAYKTDLAQATGCYGANGEASYWWLRSGDYDIKGSAGQIIESGALDTTTVTYDNVGVRAAFRITL